MRLLTRIPAVVLVPILLVGPALAVAVGLIINAARQASAMSQDLVGQSMRQIQARTQERIADLVGKPGRATALNARLLERGQISLDDLRRWRTTLADELDAFRPLSAISWAGADGRATWVARYAGQAQLTYSIKDEQTGTRLVEHYLNSEGDIDGAATNSYEYDVISRPWYRTSVDAGKPAWTEPFVWEGGDTSIPPTIGIGFGRPFHGPDGALLGVLDAEFTLDELSRFLSSLDAARDGVVFVTDRDQRLLATSTGEATTRGDRITPLAESTTPAIRAFAAAGAGAGAGAAEGDASAGGDTAAFSLMVDGGRWLAGRSHFEDSAGLAWTVVTLTPESVFTAAIDAARMRNWAVVAGAVGAILLLGVGMALLMVRPLLRLEAHAQRVGEGELSETLDLRQTPELRRLSTAINTMTAGLRDRMRLRHSLALAQEVQEALLPAKPPQLEGLDVWGRSLYCEETGGDYYDYLDISPIDGGALGIAVGDVMGHGIAAAMLMATARGMLRSHSTSNESLGTILTRVNELLVPDTGGTRFMTMLLILVRRAAGTARWASAGHGPPLVYSPGTDEFLDLQGGELPLGVMEGVTYTDGEIGPLAPGMILVAATDGVWEAKDPSGRLFGMDRLREVIRAAKDESARRISEAIYEAVDAFTGSHLHEDDVTLVVTKITADRNGVDAQGQAAG